MPENRPTTCIVLDPDSNPWGPFVAGRDGGPHQGARRRACKALPSVTEKCVTLPNK